MTTNSQPLRRMKTYAGGQGYVYQYYFVGKRPAEKDGAAATEFIFDVTSDRKTTFSVSVFLSQAAVQAWATAHGRALTEAEQYGGVKMRLFEAFDEVEDMMGRGRQLDLDPDALVRLLDILGVK